MSAAALACLVLVVEQQQCLLARTLAWPPLGTMGRLSYSLYLWHFLPTIATEHPELPRAARFFFVLASSAALAIASFYLLEQPVLRLRRPLHRVTVTTATRGTTVTTLR